MQNETKSCQNCKQDFVIEQRDFEFYAKIRVPAPTWCPTCRAMRRMMFSNFSQLFRKTEKRTGKVLFSTYPEKSPVEIYERDYWWSDSWDAITYGRDYDFSRPFFDQMRELLHTVPLPNQNVRGMVNSEYSNEASYLKNCYLCMNGGESENLYYCQGFNNCHDCIDIFGILDSDLCYESFQGSKNYQCFFCTFIFDCLNVWFCNDCTGSQNCFGCTGLKNKQFCLFNKQLSKEEYQIEIAKMDTGSYTKLAEWMRKAQEINITSPHKNYHGTNCVNTTGDYLGHCKNALDCYEASNIEDSRFIDNVARGVKDCYDYTNWGESVSLLYESIGCGDECNNLKFAWNSWPAMRDSEYVTDCHASANLFGCIGLRKKQYCILNKQYGKEEYSELVEKIKKHMDERPYVDKAGRVYKYGEFYPLDLSPLAYNESLAFDVFPKTEDEAGAMGLAWREQDKKEFTVTCNANTLSDHIKDIPDSITKELIACLGCKKAYRILPQELEFYRRFNLPLPRYCHRCRYATRLLQRNPRRLYDRTCAKCSAPIKTTYSPDRPEIVYCESCYQIEVT